MKKHKTDKIEDSEKRTGHDRIKNKNLKSCSSVIEPYLAQAFDDCFQQ